MSGRISDQIIEQVRHANDVVDVIGAYFPLKKAGANFRALCPFHKEKTPSFNVTPSKQIWHCFGCGTGGDVFKFVMQYENLDFLAAVRRLAERAGIKVEAENATGMADRSEKELLLKLHDEVAAFFQENLRSAEVAKKYLEKRKISAEVARKWRIGYAPDAWDGLLQWARGKKHKPALLETAGLALPRDGGGLYDRFRGRLMFSICDEQGRVVGFSGRILTDAKDQPKYVNSPETPIFQKGRILFALDKAKRSIIEEKFAVICEGQIDTIACHEAGITNVVAPQGTALTEQHARILKRYAEEVVLMYDADEAGQNAIVRSAEPLWEAGVAMRAVVIPSGHDPDSFIKAEGGEKLQQLIAGGESFFAYLLKRLSRQHDPSTERGKLQIARQMAEWLVRISSPVLLATYTQQTAQRLDVPEDAIRQELRKLQRDRQGATAASARQNDVEEAIIEMTPSLPAETLLLQLMLTDVRLVDLALERLDPLWLTTSLAGATIGRVLKLHADGKWDGPHTLMNAPADEVEGRLVSELLVKTMPGTALEAAAGDCLATLERTYVKGQLHGLRKRLGHADLPTAERVRLQREMLDLELKLRHTS
ncbi:MAG: DNA primase [Verrucomicrobiota bacterium]